MTQHEVDNYEIDHEVLKVNISDLVPHEGVLDWHIKEIRDWMEKDGFQLRPIAVSRLDDLGPKWKGKFLIHDGHHRTAALEELGCTRIMAGIFDFSDPRIKVFDYDDTSIPVSKETVIEQATSGVKLTPRFDKHFIEVKGKLYPFHDNSILEPEIRVSLSELN
ncbi:MAG: ParB N-terminal domain-containing protein [Nitrososphaerales archaeon]